MTYWLVCRLYVIISCLALGCVFSFRHFSYFRKSWSVEFPYCLQFSTIVFCIANTFQGSEQKCSTYKLLLMDVFLRNVPIRLGKQRSCGFHQLCHSCNGYCSLYLDRPLHQIPLLSNLTIVSRFLSNRTVPLPLKVTALFLEPVHRLRLIKEITSVGTGRYLKIEVSRAFKALLCS